MPTVSRLARKIAQQKTAWRVQAVVVACDGRRAQLLGRTTRGGGEAAAPPEAGAAGGGVRRPGTTFQPAGALGASKARRSRTMPTCRRGMSQVVSFLLGCSNHNWRGRKLSLFST